MEKSCRTDRRCRAQSAERKPGPADETQIAGKHTMKAHPTRHRNVNEMLNILFTDVKAILGDQFVGMYLFGSLANGDFDNASDIDVLVVTKDKLADVIFSSLHAMHEKISRTDSPWAVQLEVSYIPQDALRRYDPQNNRHPHLDRGTGENLHIMQHDVDWIIQRYILRERGIRIMGP